MTKEKMNAYSSSLKVNLLLFLKKNIQANSFSFFFKAVSLPLNLFWDVGTFSMDASLKYCQKSFCTEI